MEFSDKYEKVVDSFLIHTGQGCPKATKLDESKESPKDEGFNIRGNCYQDEYDCSESEVMSEVES